MFIKSQVILLLSVSVIVSVSESVSDTLEVIVTNTRLPSPRAYITTGYDGDDNIYLWGGALSGGDWSRDILKYSISKQTIENIGTVLVSRVGSGCWIGNNKFVHLGGDSSNVVFKNVWNFGTTNPSNWTTVTALPYGLTYSSSIWDEEENVYIIGGSSTIYKYSSTTQTVVNVGTLHVSIQKPAAVWDSRDDSAYIFGGHISSYSKDILKFDAVNGEVTTLNAKLPGEIGYASAIWNGKEAYIIGGTSVSTVTPPPIVRFNPVTNVVTSFPVNNFPTKLYWTGCVYVEKLNRIYIFGGSSEYRYRDEIMYIDLNDSGTPPTTTEDSTTEGKPTTEPTIEPTTEPTIEPTTEPTTVSTTKPTTEPTTKPTTQPTTEQTSEPTTVPAAVPTTEPTKESTTSKSPVDFECPTETGLYADPKNCRGFYNCDAWFPYHFCCPLPLFYNPANERCDFQDMVECHNDPGLPCDSPPWKLN